MKIDTRRMPIILALAANRITYRQLADVVSKLIGRPVSHQTMWNIANEHGMDTAEDIKDAVCKALNLDHFPEVVPVAEAGEQHECT